MTPPVNGLGPRSPPAEAPDLAGPTPPALPPCTAARPGRRSTSAPSSRPARDISRDLAPLSREDSDVRGEPRAPDADPEGPRRRRRGAGRAAGTLPQLLAPGGAVA